MGDNPGVKSVRCTSLTSLSTVPLHQASFGPGVRLRRLRFINNINNGKDKELYMNV